MIKRLNASIAKINNNFTELDFDTRIEFLVKILVGFVQFPSIEENKAIKSCEVDMDKMRKKILKFTNDKKNVYLNYLENYRVCESMFEDNNNIVFDFVNFLLDLPNTLRELLISNIIIVGGFSLTNGFFKRFQSEVKELILNYDDAKEVFPESSLDKFKFTNINYPCNLISWASNLIFYRLL